MGLLTDYIKRGWAQEDLAKQQQSAQGLIGAPSQQIDAGQPVQQMQEIDPATGEQYSYEKSVLPTTQMGTGFIGQMEAATTPQEQQRAQARLYGGLIGTPGMEQIGAQGLQGMLGRQGTGQKPTGIMQNLLAAGYTQDTPEYKQAMRDYISKPQTQINMGTKAIPVTDLMKMRMPDGSRPPVGMTPDQALQAGVTLKKDVSADSASKLAMLDTARQGMATIEPILFKDGKIDRDVIKSAWGIGVAEPIAGLVSPEAGKLFAGFEYGIQAITRAETGAAMPSSEIDNTRKRFMPKPWDSDDVVRQKWSAYQLFINNASKYINPKAAKAGNWGGAIDFTKLMDDAKNNKQPGLIGGKPKTVRFEDL